MKYVARVSDPCTIGRLRFPRERTFALEREVQGYHRRAAGKGLDVQIGIAGQGDDEAKREETLADVIPLTRDAIRSRRKHDVRPETENLVRVPKRVRELREYIYEDTKRHLELYKVPPRPKTRGACESVPRPCPYVSCRHNLFLDVLDNGNITIVFPDREPGEMPPESSCVLDLVDAQGEVTLEKTGEALNVTRERIRQIEAKLLPRLKKKALVKDMHSMINEDAAEDEAKRPFARRLATMVMAQIDPKDEAADDAMEVTIDETGAVLNVAESEDDLEDDDAPAAEILVAAATPIEDEEDIGAEGSAVVDEPTDERWAPPPPPPLVASDETTAEPPPSTVQTSPQREPKQGKIIMAAKGERPAQVVGVLEKETEPVTAAEIAGRIGMTSSNVAAILSKLHAEGRLARTGEKPARWSLRPNGAASKAKPKAVAAKPAPAPKKNGSSGDRLLAELAERRAAHEVEREKHDRAIAAIDRFVDEIGGP